MVAYDYKTRSVVQISGELKRELGKTGRSASQVQRNRLRPAYWFSGGSSLCVLPFKTAILATTVTSPIGTRKNPNRLRKFDPVRHE
jgi:hypothetical protein